MAGRLVLAVSSSPPGPLFELLALPRGMVAEFQEQASPRVRKEMFPASQGVAPGFGAVSFCHILLLKQAETKFRGRDVDPTSQ